MRLLKWKRCLPAAGLVLAFTAAAQQKSPVKPGPYQDVLYLKNGSVLRGRVLDAGPGQLRFENRVKDTLVFAAGEVERTAQETVPPRVSAHGFYNINEIGAQFSGQKGLVLRCIAGYRFAYQWQAGAGIGLDDYDVRSVPVFADLRYDFSRAERTFFAYSGGGVAVPWLADKQLVNNKQPDKSRPGLYVHAGLGYKIRWRHNDALHISAGYSHAALQTKYAILDWTTREPLGTYTTYNYSFNRVTITAGFTF